MGLESLLGGLADNLFARNRQEDTQAFNAEQYAKRYQVQIEDMKKAGINPMLSVSQGAGAAPSSTSSSPGSNFTQAALQSAQIANINADTENKDAQRKLLEAQASQATASAGQATANIGQINATVNKINEEIKNIPTEGRRLEQLVYTLSEQANLAHQQQLSEVAKRQQMMTLIQKIKAETNLLDLDIEAAKSLDNIGRSSKQLEPIVNMLKLFIRK